MIEVPIRSVLPNWITVPRLIFVVLAFGVIALAVNAPMFVHSKAIRARVSPMPYSEIILPVALLLSLIQPTIVLLLRPVTFALPTFVTPIMIGAVTAIAMVYEVYPPISVGSILGGFGGGLLLGSIAGTIPGFLYVIALSPSD